MIYNEWLNEGDVIFSKFENEIFEELLNFRNENMEIYKNWQKQKELEKQ